MSLPSYHDFMKPTLVRLQDGQIHSRRELYEQLADELKIEKEDREIMNAKGSMFLYQNRISWALTYLKKAQLIISPQRAYFQITSLGQEVLEHNPPIIDTKYLLRYDSFQKFIENNDPFLDHPSTNLNDSNQETSSPIEKLEQAHQLINNQTKDDLLSEILGQSSSFFEKLVVDLLVAMGYGGSRAEHAKVLGRSGDGGIDGVIKEDALGFDKIYVQAKRYEQSNKIGRPALQQFVGALSGQGASKGAFITTSEFTKEAIEFAHDQKVYSIVLIDGPQLVDLMFEYNVGVSVLTTYEIKRIDSDYFGVD